MNLLLLSGLMGSLVTSNPAQDHQEMIKDRINEGVKYLEKHAEDGKEYFEEHWTEGKDYLEKNAEEGVEYFEKHAEEGTEYVKKYAGEEAAEVTGKVLSKVSSILRGILVRK